MNSQKLKAIIVEHYKTQDDIAKAIGIDRSTFYRKMAHDTFSVNEANRIIKAVPLTMEEAVQVFFYPQCHKNETKQ